MRPLPAAALVSAALLLAACGGGSDASPAAGSSAGTSGGVLTVATEGTYAPFSFHATPGSELTGYDVEVVEAVAEELGMEVEFSETQFDAIFAGLEAGRYDVVANQITINEERQARYLFTEPYTVSQGVVVTRADDASVDGIEDVEGKKSAQSSTSSFAEIARTAGAQVETVEGFAQAVTLLKQGRVDVTINDSLAVLEYQKTTGDDDVKIAAEVDEASRQALVLRKDSGALQEKIDGALATLRADGTLARISEEYFGEDVSGPTAG